MLATIRSTGFGILSIARPPMCETAATFDHGVDLASQEERPSTYAGHYPVNGVRNLIYSSSPYVCNCGDVRPWSRPCQPGRASINVWWPLSGRRDSASYL